MKRDYYMFITWLLASVAKSRNKKRNFRFPILKIYPGKFPGNIDVMLSFDFNRYFRKRIVKYDETDGV